MNKEHNATDSSKEVLSTFMESVGKFCNTMFQAWSDMEHHFKFQESTLRGEKREGKQTSMDSAIKSFQAFSKALFEPNVMESLLNGTGAMPEILTKMGQSSFNSWLQLQQKWIERAGRLGNSTEAFKFENLDENAFRAWSDIYEKEFRQFFNIPQLGLTRFRQEKLNHVLDRSVIFQSTFAEFLRLLYLPVTHSLTVMQEKLGEMLESESLPEDAKTYYQMWIKTLEGHYMVLFKSPEYVEILGKTLESMSKLTKSRNEVLEDMLAEVPIPKQKEMDDLYQELYLLKKRVKTLEKKAD